MKYICTLLVYWFVVNVISYELSAHPNGIGVDHIKKDDMPSVISNFTKAYLSSKNENWKYPEIVNLVDIVSQFVSKHCLIIIDNFRTINLRVANKYPVISRTLHPLSLRTMNDTFHRIIFGPKNFKTQNLSMEESTGSLKCPFSNYYQHASKYVGDLCYALNMRSFASNSKPWNCHVGIFIYPPAFYYKEYWRRDELSEYTPGNNLILRKRFPHIFIPAVRIFIVHENENATIEVRQLRSKIIQHSIVSRTWIDKSCRQVLLIAFTRISIKSRKSKQSIIVNANLLGACPQWDGEYSQQNLMNVDLTDLSDFYKLLKAVLPTMDAHLIWLFHINREMGSLLGKVHHFLRICDKLQPLSGRTWYSSPLDRIAHAYAHLWLSMVGNYTIVNMDEGGLHVCCIKGRRIEDFTQDTESVKANVDIRFISYVKSAFIFPHFFQDQLSGLKFVGCGRRGLSTIPFSELTSIFDTWVWLLLILSLSSVAISFRIDEKYNGWSHWLSLVKVLLEQGTPFLDTTISTLRAKWVAGSFLLIGIVVSNAYKNINLYHMVAPRKPIPYQFFDEIRNDGYTIYSRIATVLINNYYPGPLWQAVAESFMKIAGNNSVKYLEVENGSVIAISEVCALLLEVYKMSNGFAYFSDIALNSKSSISLSILQNSTKVSDNIDDSLRRVFNIITTSFKGSGVREIRDTNGIMATDVKYLFQRLKNCNKVALVLPEYLSRQYFINLTKENNQLHAFLGKESFSGLQWAFTWIGVLPPHLPQRLKGVHEGGIWSRWMLLTRGLGVVDNSNLVVVGARMDGNIIVVFAVWLSGILASVVFLVAECSCRWVSLVILSSTV